MAACGGGDGGDAAGAGAGAGAERHRERWGVSWPFSHDSWRSQRRCSPASPARPDGTRVHEDVEVSTWTDVATPRHPLDGHHGAQAHVLANALQRVASVSPRRREDPMAAAAATAPAANVRATPRGTPFAEILWTVAPDPRQVYVDDTVDVGGGRRAHQQERDLATTGGITTQSQSSVSVAGGDRGGGGGEMKE